MAERPQHEMVQKSHFRDTFFSVKALSRQRPDSVHTEFMETDWEEDDILSELEDDEGSPRQSLDSSGRPSITTLSTYDEVRTPEQGSIACFEMGPDPVKPIVGPRGPHLFRSSISSVTSLEFQNALSLSPISPKVFGQDFELDLPIAFETDFPTPRAPRTNGPLKFTNEQLDTSTLAQWSAEKVAQWMLDAGVELHFAETFVENDINGAILITLKFEDLKELGIASFGVRTKIWDEVAKIKDMRAASPAPETPIEDEPSREVKREQKRQDRRDGEADRKRSQSSRRRRHHADDAVRPEQSVSIVGIEQVLPKPHSCSKGENCRKWRKQQRMMEAFKNDHPYVNLDSGGVVMIAGDPGNPATAKAIWPEDEVVFRPVSDTGPSVVASSDILGTEGLAPLQYLRQATLQNARDREQQNNVRNFLALQHQHGAGAAATGASVPLTPPFEMLPPRKKTPHGGLKALSKLSIPTHTSRPAEEVLGSACPGSACPGSAYPPSAHTFGRPQPSFAATQRQASLPTPAPAPAPSPSPAPSPAPSLSPASRSQTPAGGYRLGTPCSEMNVSYVSADLLLGPVARDASQSVPPEMNYHTAANPPPPSRSMSRSTFRRPPFMTMPSLDEDAAEPPRRPAPLETSRQQLSPRARPARPLQAPPRAAWPWSPPVSARHFETAIAPIPAAPSQGYATSSNSSSSNSSSGSSSKQHTPSSSISSSGTTTTSAACSTTATIRADPRALASDPAALDGFQYQGYMKKRKTKLLRHEWTEQYVTLRGTRLAMHADRIAVGSGRTLEYVDIDDYAVACAGLASSGRLNAALKAMSIRKDKGLTREDIAAFSFQLVPQGDMLKAGGAGASATAAAAVAAAAAAAAAGVRLRKRESGGWAPRRRGGSWDGPAAAAAPPPPPPSEGINGTGKTHHFAVRGRDERIDWMRELMLAKALKQKGEGFEVSVNGNMI